MKFSFDNLTPEKLARYNAADAMLTADVWDRIQPSLQQERHIYEHDKKLAMFCQEMGMVGIRQDQAVKQELSAELGRRAAEQLAIMKSIAGPDFNPNVPKHLRRALFGQLGAPILKGTKTGLAATDKAVLAALAGTDTEAGHLAKAISEWRYAAKLRATFVDGVRPEKDGRVHAGWRSFGTISSRLACRNPNLMNIPRPRFGLDPRAMYIPSLGNSFEYFDVGQAEMRFAAYLSGDEIAIREIESGDVYVAAAKTLFGNIPGAIEALDAYVKDKKTAPKLAANLRQLAKMARLAANYLIVADSLYPKLKAEGLNVDYNGVRKVLDKIHFTYRTYFRFVDTNVELVKQCGYIEDPILGRKRRLGFEPSGPDVANYPIQAGIGAAMNERMLEIAARLKTEAPASHIVCQVHDSCFIDTPQVDAPKVRAIIAEVWDRSVVLKNGRSFKLPVEQKSLQSMSGS